MLMPTERDPDDNDAVIDRVDKCTAQTFADDVIFSQYNSVKVSS